jgi:chemotaxis signal transduction protein
MAKVSTLSESPANKALQHYFDDLTSLKPAHLPLPNSADFVPQEAQIQHKISHAERLLAKASCLTNLLTGSAHESINTISQVSVPELIESKLTPQIIDVRPTEEGEIQSASTTSINNDISDGEKNTTLDKEKRVNADTYNTQGNNNGQTRNLSISLKDSLPNRFQVLLCDIANVTIAIPLIELGGIHQLTQISSIAKQPSWCKGILIKGSDKFTCIDAAAWLVPKRYAATKLHCEYKFAVQIGKSPYVLCCNSVSATLDLCKDDIKWRDNTTNRPWLSGLLKEKMCALIDGAQMLQGVLK